MNEMNLTRKRTECAILGHPKDLQTTVLPTYEDVIKACQHERITLLQLHLSSKEPSFSAICETVANSVINIWIFASIPIVLKKRVKDMLYK